mmetsp:Transcript_75889/g.220369  ORF Transcript_75889/g.220369 Transcript_75889/m.220369 type:complete len:225 (+) Transcript_75889:410-1084(+)
MVPVAARQCGGGADPRGALRRHRPQILGGKQCRAAHEERDWARPENQCVDEEYYQDRACCEPSALARLRLPLQAHQRDRPQQRQRERALGQARHPLDGPQEDLRRRGRHRLQLQQRRLHVRQGRLCGGERVLLRRRWLLLRLPRRHPADVALPPRRRDNQRGDIFQRDPQIQGGARGLRLGARRCQARAGILRADGLPLRGGVPGLPRDLRALRGTERNARMRA